MSASSIFYVGDRVMFNGGYAGTVRRVRIYGMCRMYEVCNASGGCCIGASDMVLA